MAGLSSGGCDNSPNSSTEPPEELREADHYPVWSGANNLIAYIHEQTSDTTDIDSPGVYTIRPDGTEKQLLYYSDSGDNYDGLDWFPDGHSLITNSGRRLVRIFYPEGTADTLTDEGEYWAPVVSPNGNAIAFSRRLGTPAGIYLLMLDGSVPNKIIDDGDAVDWPYSDSLLYLNLDRIYPLYNLMLANITGEFHRVVYSPQGNIIPDTPKAKMHPSTRRIIFRAQTISEPSSIWVLEPGLSEARQLQVYAETPAFSPDGNSIVYTDIHNNSGRLWIISWDGTGARQLTQ